MAITLAGAGHLEYAGNIVTTLPATLLIWGTRDNSTGNQAWINQSQTNADRRMYAYHAGSSDNKLMMHRSPGVTGSVNKATAPHATTAMKLMVAVFTSSGSRTLYFGDSTGLTDTATSPVNDISNHNLCTVGAQKYNNAVADSFAKGSFAEAHWIAGALTSTDVANLIADTVKPEDLTGWVDGWTFKDYEAGGTYTSIGGTRTMTAVGTVTSSSVTHPIARSGTPTTLTAATTSQDSVSGTGAVTIPVIGDLTGADTSQSAASGTGAITAIQVLVAAATSQSATSGTGAVTSAATAGTITPTQQFGNNTRSLFISQAVTVFVTQVADNAPVATKSLTTTADAHLLGFTDAAFVIGTSYRCTFKFASGAEGMATLAAA